MDLFHWERFEPEVGNNHQLAPTQRLYLEVACGLTKVQLKACQRAVQLTDISVPTAELEAAVAAGESVEDASVRLVAGLCADKLAAVWGQFVRLGGGPHTLGGRPVATLRDYLAVVLEQPGAFQLLELSRAIAQFNSVTGTKALFSRRLSGGLTFTADQRTDADAAATESR